MHARQFNYLTTYSEFLGLSGSFFINLVGIEDSRMDQIFLHRQNNVGMLLCFPRLYNIISYFQHTVAAFSLVAIHLLLSSGFAMTGVQFSNVNNKFKYLMCDVEFQNEGGIMNHNKIHNRFYPYRCRRCHNIFKTKSHLENHEQNNEHAINNQVPQ